MNINLSNKYNNHRFSIIHNFSSSSSINEFHCHNVYEILVPFCDDMKCSVNNQSFDVVKGDVFIFPPLVSHKAVVSSKGEDYERYVLHFNSEYITSFSPLADNLLKELFVQAGGIAMRIQLDEEQMNNLLVLIGKAWNYARSSVYAQEVYIQHTLFEILLLLNKACYMKNSNHDMCKNVDYFKVKDILAFMNANIAEDLSLDYIAAKFYMSRTYINKLFKLHTGSTIIQYITNIRIITAQKLLRDGLSVTETCEKVGFNNYSNFIRTFTKIVGISPKQYAIEYTKRYSQKDIKFKDLKQEMVNYESEHR